MPVSVVRSWLLAEWGKPYCPCDRDLPSANANVPDKARQPVSEPDREPTPLDPVPATAPLPPKTRKGEAETAGSKITPERPSITAPEGKITDEAHGITSKGSDLILWGLSGWSLVTAVAAAAATGGAAIPVAGVAAYRFARATGSILKDVRELRASRKPTKSIEPDRGVQSPACPIPAPEVPAAPFPRALDEARELLQLRQAEGRVSVLDAIRGMALDDELAKAEHGGDPARTKFLRDLIEKLDRRVDEIAPRTTRGTA
jgi:hypothetical protein